MQTRIAVHPAMKCMVSHPSSDPGADMTVHRPMTNLRDAAQDTGVQKSRYWARRETPRPVNTDLTIVLHHANFRNGLEGVMRKGGVSVNTCDTRVCSVLTIVGTGKMPLRAVQ